MTDPTPTFLGRVPPHDEAAEVSVLGSCLLKTEALDEALDILVPEDFYSEVHETLFRGIAWLRSKNRPVDLVTLTALLQQHDRLEQVGGVSYVAGLLDRVPTTANVAAHADVVRNCARLRATIAACIGGIERGYAEVEDVDEYLSMTVSSVETAAMSREKSRLQPLSALVPATVKDLERLHNEKVDPGVPTGLRPLDNILGGLQDSDLILLAGRPSMGKTALAMTAVVGAASRTFPVLVFSLEMSSPSLVRRLLGMEGRVDSRRIRVPRYLEGDDWGRLIGAGEFLHGLPIYIDDSADVTVVQIRARSRRLVRKHGIRLIVIDYLQIIKEVSKRGKDRGRERAVAEILAELKAMAKELGVPVLVLCQLNRDCEKRADKRPILSDLRESGAAEQDADTVLMLYREAHYNPECGHNDAEVLVRKNRNGPIGTVVLAYLKELMRYEMRAQGDVPEGRDTRIEVADAWDLL